MAQNNGEEETVVSLTEYRGSMQHPALSTVEAYWEALRAGRLVPRRAEVDPRGIDQALEYAFILERVAPGMARFRLAGMHLNDLMGMEVRGMPLTSFFAPDARRTVSETLEHVFEEPATARLILEGECGIGKPELPAELLLLPLKSDLGDISRILGCLVARGTIGRSPRRFTVSEIHRTPLLKPHAVDPSAFETPEIDDSATLPNPASLGFRDPPKPFTPRPTASQAAPLRGERPYLKLVREDD